MVEIHDAEPVKALKPALELAPDASLALTCLAGGVALVFKKYPCVAARGAIKPNIKAAAAELRQYSQDFVRDGGGRYMVTCGPQASGKTTLLQAAFGGKRYAGYHEVSLYAEEVRAVDFEKKIGTQLPGGKWMTTERRLRLLDRFCRVVYRHPYVAVINLKINGIANHDMKHMAVHVDTFGRGMCYDTITCPVVFETAVPQLADAIKKVASGSICGAIDVPPLSLEEFKVCFAEYVMSGVSAKETLAILGYKPTTPPKSGWLGPNDESRKAYTAWANKILLHKLNDGGPGINTVEDLATEYFYKVGPDVRRLTGLIEEKEEKQTFAEMIEIAHDDLKERLESLTDDEKQLVRKLLAAGPTGYGARGNDTKSKSTLLGRTTWDTLVRGIGSRITLHHVGHVYALLMQEHNNDDAQVRALMKQYGWVDMTYPEVTAGGA